MKHQHLHKRRKEDSSYKAYGLCEAHQEEEDFISIWAEMA